MGTDERAEEHDRAALSRDKWRRIKVFWAWCGRPETGDKQVLRLIARYAPDAPLGTLERAQRGDPRGGGQTSRVNAHALVGPLLGVDYGDPKRPAAALDEYKGPAPPALLSSLRALDEREHLELADAWTDFLRAERDEPPPPIRRLSHPEDSFEVKPDERPDAARGEPEQASRAATRTRPVRIGAVALLAATLAATGALWRNRDGPTPPRPDRDPAVNTQQSVVPAQAPPGRDPAAAALPSSHALDAAPPPVRFFIEAMRGEDHFVADDGAELQSGDRLAFYVRVDEPLFVQLLLLPERGSPVWLYPVEGAVQAKPGERCRLPRRGEGDLELDDETGIERMVLLTTATPLARDRKALRSVVRRLLEHPGWPARWSTPQVGIQPTARSVVHTRGIVLRPASRRAGSADTLVTAHFVTLEHR